MSRSTIAAPPSDSNTSAEMSRAAFNFLHLVWCRKTYLIATLTISGLLGVAYVMHATPTYQATASLLVTQIGTDVWSTNISYQSSRDALMPTYESLLSSTVVLKGALERMRKMPVDQQVDFEGHPPEKWLKIMRDNLTARSIARTNRIEIAYRSRSGLAAEAIVDAVVRSFLDFMDKNQRDVAVEILSILGQERKEVEDQLTQKQQELLAIKHRFRDLGLRGESNPAIQRVVKLNASLTQLHDERLILEAKLAAVRNAVKNGDDLFPHLNSVEHETGQKLLESTLGLDSWFGKAWKSHELLSTESELGSRLTPTERLQLGPMLIGIVQQQLDQNRVLENDAREHYQQAEIEAVSQSDRLAELQLVEAELLRLQSLYRTLLDRISTIDLNRDQVAVRVALVNPPTLLDMPVSPRVPFVISLCVLAGLGGGIMIIYLLDLLDERFHSHEDLTQYLDAPVLAIMPTLPRSNLGSIKTLQAHHLPEAEEGEALRTLRTTLILSGQDQKTIAVTSMDWADGKTTVLANLAAAFAQAGRKTLLIDGDLRRQGLSQLLEMCDANGLSQVLQAGTDIAVAGRQSIRPSGIENLDVLPSGPGLADPALFLGGERMKQLLAWAEGTYDQILIDCPPVRAGSDAAIVGRIGQGTIFVVRLEKNQRGDVRGAIDGLRALRVHLIGVVGNVGGGKQPSFSKPFNPCVEEKSPESIHIDSIRERRDDPDAERKRRAA